MKGTGIKRGALIVFEGCDKAGKTTQCRKLVEKLVELGFSAQMMQFPDRTTATGKIINDYLTMKQELPDQAIHLLFSANRWENQPHILQLLQKGVTLVFDRYSYSGVAYSAAKPGMDFSWCQKPEIGFPKPDLVFLLHLPSDVTTGRNSFGCERYEKDEFLQNVYKNYLKMKNDNWVVGVADIFCFFPPCIVNPSKVHEIDAGKSIEELHEELLQHAKETIETAQTNEIGQLW